MGKRHDLEKLTQRVVYLETVARRLLDQVEIEPPGCVAELETRSGHNLHCTEQGQHSTHRFVVEV